jgi:hypothetical protein
VYPAQRPRVDLLAAALLLALTAACASPNAAVEVALPALENPDGDATFRIRSVEDARAWQHVPGSTQVQSLRGIDAGDRALTARVIGRARGVSGGLMENVLLAEGTTVAELVTRAVTNGFRAAGYRLLDPGQPGSEAAQPVDLLIRHFWVRMETARPGAAWTFRTEVWLRAPLAPFAAGAWACGDAFLSRGGPSPGVWARAATLGLEDLTEKLDERLRAGRLLPWC